SSPRSSARSRSTASRSMRAGRPRGGASPCSRRSASTSSPSRAKLAPMTVLAEERDRVLHLTLSAPERGNSVDRSMLGALEEQLTALTRRIEAREIAAPRVVLLRGAGERSFCTGYNIEELVRELGEGPSVNDEAQHPLERALRALDECPAPTLALVHGNAYGAGCELASACDLRVAADDARFCMPPAKLGVLYSASGTRRLIELVGVAATKEMFFTAEPVAAA